MQTYLCFREKSNGQEKEKVLSKNVIIAKSDLPRKNETFLQDGSSQTNGTDTKDDVRLSNGKSNIQIENNGFLKNSTASSVTLVKNGVVKPNGIFSLNGVSNGTSLNSATPISSIKRKRLLSDRGERELEYPVCDVRTSTNGWSGCFFVVFFYLKKKKLILNVKFF